MLCGTYKQFFFGSNPVDILLKSGFAGRGHLPDAGAAQPQLQPRLHALQPRQGRRLRRQQGHQERYKSGF